jgi:Kef-type K+ transport system membrane component KefB
MDSLSSQDITIMLLSFGILLGFARVFGELAQKLKQPAVLGEIFAGIILGPTVLGNIFPQISRIIFPQHGSISVALDTIATLSLVLFLLVAGMEVDLSTVWRQGKSGLKIGIVSMVIPFIFGLFAAILIPQAIGYKPGVNPFIFNLFIATALSISALPLIAKTLMDMDLYRSDFGMLVISAAVFNDIVGWIIFAIILGMMGSANAQQNHFITTIILTLLFASLMLTLGRWLIHKTLPLLQAYTRWPNGVIGFAMTLSLFGASFTEWIGIHAIFGSFIVGVSIGDSSNLRERTRVTIEHFVSSIFAPVFFAMIGLKVNFLTNFDIKLNIVLLTIACICKLLGGYIGGRWSDIPRKEAWAIGFALNSRGAMEIILGLLALKAGIIQQNLFVALVVMAIVTSVLSGPVMRLILGHGAPKHFSELLSSRLFFKNLKANTNIGIIHEMSQAISEEISGIDYSLIVSSVCAREESLGTGIGNGVAIPHARIHGLSAPLVAVGISNNGIDFDAPDEKLANLIFMILTPIDDSGAQISIVSEIARLIRNKEFIDKTSQIQNYTDFLAVIKSCS